MNKPDLAEALKTAAADMRSARLNRAALKEYARQLEAQLGMNSTDLATWRELQLVCVSYLRDFERASLVVNGALEHFPDNPEFLRWKSILAMWKRVDPVDRSDLGGTDE